jgi:hypothetical protein
MGQIQNSAIDEKWCTNFQMSESSGVREMREEVVSGGEATGSMKLV